MSPAPSAAEFTPLGLAGPPVFRAESSSFSMFYAPGLLVLAPPPAAAALEWALADAGPAPAEDIARLRDQIRARIAAAERARRPEPFQPTSLTLYLHGRCNLCCRYCYADAGPARAERLDPRAIAAAAELVARTCARLGRPFVTALHGGGEPTLDPRALDTALDLLDGAARAQGLPTFRYLATNGVMPERRARRLAQRFDLIGVSCDGPPDIQNRQRPTVGSRPTTPIVERTARVLHEAGCPIQARVTVTRSSAPRLPEIVAYLCDRLGPQMIAVEPVYAGGRADRDPGLGPVDPAAFVEAFVAARRLARSRGVALSYAGSRVGELHGPYCNVLRDALYLVPGGVATACFKDADAHQARARGTAIGAWDAEIGSFALDEGRIAALRQRLAARPRRCEACINRYHCVGECPDSCACAPGQAASEADAGVRCAIQQLLTGATLREIADEHQEIAARGAVAIPVGDARRAGAASPRAPTPAGEAYA